MKSYLLFLVLASNTMFSQIQHKDSLVIKNDSIYNYNTFSSKDLHVLVILNDSASFTKSTSENDTFNYKPYKDVNILLQIAFKDQEKNYHSESELQEIGRTLEQNLKKIPSFLGFSYDTAEISGNNILYTNYISREDNKYNLFSQYLYSIYKKDVLLMCYVHTDNEDELNEIINKFLPEFQELAINKLLISQ